MCLEMFLDSKFYGKNMHLQIRKQNYIEIHQKYKEQNSVHTDQTQSY